MSPKKIASREQDLVERLQALQGSLPTERSGLTEAEKDELIRKVGGPKTAINILKAPKDIPLARIPFIFSSIDTQAVVDLLANDMTEALKRAKKL